MKRVWGHILAGGLLLAGAISLATACAQDDSTIFVDDVLAQQLVTPGQQCLFTSDPTQPFTASGVLDIGFRDSYQAEFLVGNQIVARGDPTKPQTETSYVQIQGAIVRITDSEGNQLADYTALGSVTIPPAQGNTPSFAPLGATIIDQATVHSAAIQGPVQNLRGTRQLYTYTRFFGQTLGGEAVETGEFEFPVTVCFGCLVGYSASDIDVNASVVPNCLLAEGSATSSSSTLPIPCFPGEDAPIDCAQCLGYAVCRGEAPASMADAGSD